VLTWKVGNQGIDQYIVVDLLKKLDVLMHFLNSKEEKRGIIILQNKSCGK
jgi:ATP-dependent RNA helicase DeaD